MHFSKLYFKVFVPGRLKRQEMWGVWGKIRQRLEADTGDCDKCNEDYSP